MSSLAPAPEGAGSRAPRVPGPARWHANGDLLLGLATAAALTLLAFTTTGGVALGPNTWAQILLVVLAAGLGIALLLTRPRGPGAGVIVLVAFGALAALTFASIAWSVQPANSWLEANRTLSYLATFAVGMALARLAPGRWRGVIGGVAAYTVVIAVYALLTKVFPASMDAGDALARLRAPFDYYNATGLVAALGIVPWMWLGARRTGATVAARGLSAFSVPAIAALVCALVLSYGRGALAAAVVAVAVWFVFVPLRLRGALILGLGTLGGAIVAFWASRQSALANNNTALSARVADGHHFGLVLLVALVVLLAVGWGTTVLLRRPAPPEPVRRRIGIVLLCALALVPLAGLAGLATSSRGFGGETSHLWNSLTNPNSVVFDQPGRLSQLGSSRPRYWRDGLRVGEHSPVAGAGAFGFSVAVKRYSPDRVLEAHSYVIQTFADFGTIGLLVSAVLLVAWVLAVRRTLGGRTGESGAADERAGLFTLLAVAVTFGVHSAIDWTWFIPGAAVPGLVCAGWLAGRGPLTVSTAAARPRRDPLRVGAAVGLAAVTLLAGWIIWQPLRSSDASGAAVSALVAGNAGAALTDARTAAAADPVDIAPHQLLSSIYLALGNPAAARAQLVQATTLQPSNPDSWSALATFDLGHHNPSAAARELARVAALTR